MSTLKYEDRHFLDTVKQGGPTVGYSAGAVLSFKVKNRYFLHTEYLYTLRSKSLKGKLDPYLKDKTTYHYFEVPIMFTMQFKGHIGKGREFKWFMGVGPNISYLIGGKGRLQSGVLIESNLPEINYKIKYGTRVERDRPDEVYYSSGNRVQFGINLGTGMIIEPARNHRAIVDVRYTFDQTVVGKAHADYLLPPDYHDNLRFRHRGLKMSVMYLLEYNISKKSRHKGKSTIKHK